MHMSQERRKKQASRHHLQKGEQGIRSFQEFRRKVSNDRAMRLAAGLAYHLIVAFIPMAIALFSVLGFTLGRLNPVLHAHLMENLKNALPSPITLPRILEPAFAAIRNDAGFLSILSLLAAIFGGSRLFIAIEEYFDIIYQIRMRKAVAQNVMAVLMVGVFIILMPLMVLASFVPALILFLIQHAAINRLSALMLSVASTLESLIVTWILFQTIYLIVPNRKISFKKSWKGAVVAAFLLEVFLLLFPLYITHFMGNYRGTVGFIFIFLFFFYYFAVILLIGAEANAFYAEGVHALPADLATCIHHGTNKGEQTGAE